MRRLSFALLALLALLLFARPLIRSEVFTFRDHSDYFQPLRYFTAFELSHGRLPLWNPYNASGEPWLANPQTGVFYPPVWLFVLLPFAPAYTLFLLLHLILLAWGAYLLFTRIGSNDAALIGAVAVMFCGPTLSLLDISNNLTTFAWIPLVLWCALSGAPAAWSGSAIAMSFLAGEPFFAAAGALMFVLIRRRNVIDVAVTAFCLAAIELLPFLAATVGSDRAGTVSSEEILRDSMPLSDWLHVAIPPPIGPPGIAAGLHEQFIPLVYVGLVPVLLAVIGVVTSIRRRAALAWLALLSVCILISSGSFFRPVAAVLTSLPITLVRYPARVVPLGALAVIALAVIGWDRLARFAWRRWLALVFTCLIIIDLTPRIAPLLKSAPFDPNVVPYSRAIGRDAKIVRLTSGRSRLPSFDRRAWIAGYLNLFDRRFDAWTAAPLVSRRYTTFYEAALGRRELLNDMSAGYVLAHEPIPSLPMLARAGDVTVHLNAQAKPMAYWRDAAGGTAAVKMLAFTTSAAHVTVEAPADGEVVLTQQDAPGWSVSIDDRAVASSAAGAFRSVRVSAGHHEINWRYRPPLFLIGAALSALAVMRLLLSWRFVKSSTHKKNIFFHA
jgi:hypothetical protein